MTTESQIHANRENAKSSTGPRTEEGKARSAMNGLVHGYTSKVFVIPEAEFDDFKALELGLRQTTQPHGQLEEEIFGQILHAAWNLRRLQRWETQMLEQNPFPDEKQAKSAQLLLRYKNSHDRIFHRAVKLLSDIQTSRIAAKPYSDGGKTFYESAPLANVMRVTKNADILVKRRQQGLLPMPPPEHYRGPESIRGEPNRTPQNIL
jgi:hypothetical protein